MQTMRAEGLTSTYGEKTLFDDISFIINENDRIGLIGVNGSGKTSLLNIISGEVNPEGGGQITKPNDYTIGYLKQQPELDENKTIMEAVFEGKQPVFETIRQYELLLNGLQSIQKIHKQLTATQKCRHEWTKKMRGKLIVG